MDHTSPVITRNKKESSSRTVGESALSDHQLQQQEQQHCSSPPTFSPGEGRITSPSSSTGLSSPTTEWESSDKLPHHRCCPVCDCCRSRSVLKERGRGQVWRRKDNWSMEKAVAVSKAAWSGEWLGLRLLRKRRRSCSPGSTGHSRSLSFGLASRRDTENPPPEEVPLTHSSRANFSLGERHSCLSRGLRTLKAAKILCLAFIVLSVLGLLIKEVYIRTYVFQVRLMEGMQRPRGECLIVKLTRESRAGWGGAPSVTLLSTDTGGHTGGLAGEKKADAAGGAEGGQAVEEGGDKGRLRFGIILMSDGGMWPQKYSDESIANKRDYAALHGYDVVVATSADIDRSRPAAWSKLLLLKKHLSNYDYVMFIDIDAFVMNPTFKIEWLLDVAKKQQQMGGMDGWGAGKESDLIVTHDWNGPNSGVILLKNSDFSHWLLQECWDQEQLVRGNFPFKYEQRALHYLLQTDRWQQEGLPFYADYKVVRAHTAVIDQCAMNSYLVHPWQVLRGRASLGSRASYEPGDFILHFAGKKGRVRLKLVDYYYPIAKKAMDEYAASLKSP